MRNRLLLAAAGLCAALAIWSWTQNQPRDTVAPGMEPTAADPVEQATLARTHTDAPAPENNPLAVPPPLDRGAVVAADGPGAAKASLPTFLPVEAHDTLRLIARGGPYPYRQDGSVFQNRERRLPAQPRGYYREYTVETPGSPDRGPRRIVTGGGDGGAVLPREYFYTADHYRSFRRFDVPPAQAGP